LIKKNEKENIFNFHTNTKFIETRATIIIKIYNIIEKYMTFSHDIIDVVLNLDIIKKEIVF